ncbi:Homogentisate 1,2-dioxygenase [Tuber magnatum]|uniref:homogentisate 1,2-dioxygenase n=1 Tax=Tuber magnatum TaxID=42249 RepID=A0A317SKP7_9PEZI|nr:Homogentisate 1,2-dioxygenase [Tuber magnatum]
MPSTVFKTSDPYRYLNGFNSYHETEAIPGALPIGQNSPQKPPYGLYVEKLSGTAFTTPRATNKQTWLYRILPAASHTPFTPVSTTYASGPPPSAYQFHQIPNQLRWDPFDTDESADFIQGLRMIAGAGSASMRNGLGIYVFAAGKDMDRRSAFYNADGDWLIVLQQGEMDVQTELGRLYIRPNEILILPRGVRSRVSLPAGPIRGYVLEISTTGHFELPELGPIGSNGLANPRDFQVPLATFVSNPPDPRTPYTITCKFDGGLFTATQPHTPFDVVAWHGNYYPMKYDLGRFNTIGSISYDHPDPSIFTVLTAQSSTPGTAIADFVVFPPRWLVAEDSFRPPWFHRNNMSEFMGLISGIYDGKTSGGFKPGGASLHNIMAGHGPDAATHEKASKAPLKPTKVGEDGMAFMFESCFMVGVTEWGLRTCMKIQEDYNAESWAKLKRNFSPPEGKWGEDESRDRLIVTA